MAETVAGRLDESVRAFTDALSEIAAAEGTGASGAVADEMRQLKVKTLVSLALAEFLREGLGAALARLAEAEAIADALADDHLRARVHYQRGNIHGRVGDIARAWDGIERAMTHLDAFTEREQCSILISRGMVAFAQQRARDAADSFRQAAELAGEQGWPEQEFMARHNQGYATYLLGDLPGALALMEDAERIEAQVTRVPALLDRGQVLLEAGLITEAIAVFRAGIEAGEASRDGHYPAELDLNLARAQRLLGRTDEALAAAMRSEAGFVRLGSEAWAANARLVTLQVALERPPARSPAVPTPSGDTADDDPVDHDALAAAAADVVAVATRLGDVDLADRARTLSAQALLAHGDHSAARARLAEGGRVHRSLAEDLNRVQVTATAAAADGDIATARRLLSRAAGRLAASRRGSASLDLRTASSVHGVRLARLDLDLSRPKGAAAVLASLERWRSVFTAQPNVLRPDDPELADMTERLRSIQRAIREEDEPTELRRLQRRAGQLEDEIRVRDWTLSHDDLEAEEAPLRIRDARATLDAGRRDLVWFFADRGRLCGVGIIGGRPVVHDLMDLSEATELARQVRVNLRTATTHRLGPFGPTVWGSLRAVAERLDEALIRPWNAAGDGLVVVVHRALSAFPWAVLPSLKGVPLTVALSLTAYAARSSGSSRPAGTVPAVYIGVGPGLERGVEEAAQIARIWGSGSVRIAEQSTAGGILHALASSDVVHVAAHGTHQRESPLFSSLSMHDGPMFAHEAQRSGVSAGHVVLSACEVGTATVRPGEEGLGLAASLLSLGARSVVAAVAPVPDEVAADVMVRHHRGLAAGLASDEALAVALTESDPTAVAFLNLGGRHRP